jgi:hypothetical protein
MEESEYDIMCSVLKQAPIQPLQQLICASL